ncbi:MAG: trehalose-phosphatase [Actinomycetota bacterium]
MKATSIAECLGPLVADPRRAGILLDFDGTLAPIVQRPEDSAPVAGAGATLSSLAGRFGLVGVVSGRPLADLQRMLPVKGVHLEGLYGLPAGSSTPVELRERLDAVAREVPGAWVEPKGITVAVHYREAADPVGARAILAPVLVALAGETGHDLLEGKMVLELAPAGDSRKGGAVERLIREHDLRAALYAGDDLPDIEAFAALDKLAEEGLHTVKIAVGGSETPEALRADADLIVGSPVELVRTLSGLAEGSRGNTIEG